MVDPGFWNDLAEEFGALLTTAAALEAQYTYILGSGRGEWKLSGASRTIRRQFEILAIRGASALPNAGDSSLHAWLEALRLAQGYFTFKLTGIEQNAEGIEMSHHYADTIPRVCEPSIDLCRQLESRTREADFLEKKPNDSKSRLPLGVATTVHKTDRLKMVDDFILQCNLGSDAGLRVMKKHISLAVGHAKPRQFQYWQRSSDKATPEDDRNFRRILSMRPVEFVALLREKGIVPPGS
jgi:hypothetical protein